MFIGELSSWINLRKKLDTYLELLMLTFHLPAAINVINNACLSQNQLNSTDTVFMGNPKIHIPQNCKVKLVLYLREQLKARVKFLYVKESSWFYLLASTVSLTELTVHVTFEYSESVTPKRRPRSVQTVQSFLSCTCLRLKFWLTFLAQVTK